MHAILLQAFRCYGGTDGEIVRVPQTGVQGFPEATVWQTGTGTVVVGAANGSHALQLARRAFNVQGSGTFGGWIAGTYLISH